MDKSLVPKKTGVYLAVVGFIFAAGHFGHKLFEVYFNSKHPSPYDNEQEM